MTDLEERELSKDVGKILALLQGHEFDDSDNGLIGTVNDIMERLIKLEKLKDRVSYIIIGMALPAGYGVTKLIATIGDKVFHI